MKSRLSCCLPWFALVFAGGLLADVELGRRIYLQGLDANGKVVASSVNGMRSPAPLACVNCHRESGMGTSESGTTVPPVAWKLLKKGGYLAQDYGRFGSLRPQQDIYTRESLHRLLTSGLTPTGRELSPTMPRYRLSRRQVDDLIDYLDTLLPAPEGVDEDYIHLAVVMDASIDSSLRQQHKAFLQGLVRMKNSGTRGELKRKRHSPVQRQPQYLAYRKWKLHFRELDGPSEDWPGVLDKIYREQPVFALLAPLVGGDAYRQVAGFCEQQKLPCLFPPLPGADKGGFYSFVFHDRSRRQLEYVRQLKRQQAGKVYRLDDQGGLQPLEKREIPGISSPEEIEFLLKSYPATCQTKGVLLLRVDEAAVDALNRLHCAETPRLRTVVLPAGRLGYRQQNRLLEASRGPPLCVASSYAEPRRIPGRALRASILSRRFGIESIDEELLSKDLFAFGLLSDALYQLNGAFSRPYLLEIIEHMLNSYPNYTFYRETSGAPYQRSITGALKERCRGGMET